jgi:hypothetical protein
MPMFLTYWFWLRFVPFTRSAIWTQGRNCLLLLSTWLQLEYVLRYMFALSSDLYSIQDWWDSSLFIMYATLLIYVYANQNNNLGIERQTHVFYFYFIAVEHKVVMEGIDYVTYYRVMMDGVHWQCNIGTWVVMEDVHCVTIGLWWRLFTV